MGKFIFIIVALAISLIIVLILYLRERAIRKIFKKEILFLEEEKVELKKKNGKYFWAEIRYTRIFRSQRRKICSLLKKKAELKHQLHNYDKNSQHWEDLYLYNKT